MDYAQEQADEIEALESIYTGYFDKLTEAPPYKVCGLACTRATSECPAGTERRRRGGGRRQERGPSRSLAGAWRVPGVYVN
jgi:hypothetical protein